jgi:hypothetical protein
VVGIGTLIMETTLMLIKMDKMGKMEEQRENRQSPIDVKLNSKGEFMP